VKEKEKVKGRGVKGREGKGGEGIYRTSVKRLPTRLSDRERVQKAAIVISWDAVNYC